MLQRIFKPLATIVLLLTGNSVENEICDAVFEDDNCLPPGPCLYGSNYKIAAEFYVGTGYNLTLAFDQILFECKDRLELKINDVHSLFLDELIRAEDRHGLSLNQSKFMSEYIKAFTVRAWVISLQELLFLTTRMNSTEAYYWRSDKVMQFNRNRVNLADNFAKRIKDIFALPERIEDFNEEYEKKQQKQFVEEYDSYVKTLVDLLNQLRMNQPPRTLLFSNFINELTQDDQTAIELQLVPEKNKTRRLTL